MSSSRIWTGLLASIVTLTAGACNSGPRVEEKVLPAEEPGAAQAREVASRPAITTFTHPKTESRGIWLPARDIFVPREQLLAKLDQIKAAGFNRVMICTQFRGYVLYPDSTLLPQAPEAKGEDLMRVLIDACRARGIKADAWMEYGFYAYFTPDKNDRSMGKWLDADPSMLSVDKEGVGAITRTFGTFYSLDPSSQKAIDLLAKLNVEVATRYDIDAINLDRMRFAAWDHLSLEGRARFEKETGLKWAAWAPESREGQRLSEWKRQQTLNAVRTITTAVRKAKPGLPITSYVVPPEEKDDKSQSYDLWMAEGLLDQIAVSMYGADITKPANAAIKLLGGDTSKLLAAINAEHATSDLTTNIEQSRRMGMQGQYVWYSGTVDDADAEALKAGPYSSPSRDELKGR
jgi:uncharacterized lipoprotein YddW (UPF0748 family)